LRDAFDDFEGRIVSGLKEAGITDMRPKFNAVLRYLDEGGTHASELSGRSGLSRQALTQIVDEMEARGYVERIPDPEDRRAKLVVYTERGRAGFRDSRRVIAAIEREYRERLGDHGFEALREQLEKLA
jgi:DNA-binding MarR family transcriptional regulator